MSTPSPSADRNLIFGLLALQMDFVTREQLLDAMHAWMLDKNTPLGELLCRRGVLAEDDRCDIERLVHKHVKRHGGDPQASLAALRITPEIRQDLNRLDDFEVQASVASLPSAAPVTERPGSTTAPTGVTSGSAARFWRLREHAKGGLGEVFLALDKELHREVALKEIQAHHADNPESRARFVREAEITGNLEHPGVVPVYGLGAYADGRPFYAMRFIRGQSMHEAIARFHEADQASSHDPGTRSLELRNLLGRFVAVCNAVGYAHSRGVIHRDLKPANVMLGEYGETLVVDWGLARLLDQSESGQAAARPVLPATGRDIAPTAIGQVIGTPAYMPPEQAEGRLDKVGVPGDVFALGTMLYCLLTGKPPYEGEDVLGQARRAEVVPARRHEPSVPAALEAVCARAMAKRPEDRYPSARALAEEVQRWLADEPVQAYPESPGERLRRWGRRNRSLVTAGVVLLLAGVVSLSVGLWVVRREQALTKEALTQALEAEGRANANLELARRAIDECFNVARNHPVFQEPRMEKARKLLFEKTLPFYKQFRAQRSDDPGLHRDEAAQWYRVGHIENALGHLPEAVQAYRQAQDEFLTLTKAHPEVPGYQRDLAGTHNNLGILLAVSGKRTEALEQYQQAQSIQASLVKAHPVAPLFQKELASSHLNLGNLLKGLGKSEQAIQHYQDAMQLRVELTKAHPGVQEYQRDLAGSHNNLGELLSSLGKRTEALREYEQALKVRVALATAHRNISQYQLDLSRTYHDLGNLLKDLGKSPEALKQYRQAREIQDRLAKAHPELPEYHRDLAGTYHNLGRLLNELGKGAEAVQEYENALELCVALAKAYPNVPQYQRDLAATYHNLGEQLKDLGKGPEALKLYQQAREIQDRLAKAHPELPEYRRDMARMHFNLGELLFSLGKRDRAQQHYQQSREVIRKLAETYPERLEYQESLSGTQNKLGLALIALGKRNEASEEFQQALGIAARLTKAHPEEPRYQHELAMLHMNLGNLRSILEQRDQALQHYQHARDILRSLARALPEVPAYQFDVGVTHNRMSMLLSAAGRRLEALKESEQERDILRKLLKDHPCVPAYLRTLAGAHGNLGSLLSALGKREEALIEYQHALGIQAELVKAHPEMPAYQKDLAGTYYNLGCLHAINAASAARDLARPLPERDKRAEQYACQAVAFLKRARAEGYFLDRAEVAHMDKDDDLVSLRDRDDYKRFRASLKSVK